jgi:ankyrin repeat protein
MPLIHAAITNWNQPGHAGSVELLLDAGVDPNVFYSLRERGCSPLKASAADKDILELRTDVGQTAMALAAHRGHLNAIRLLHEEYGADLHVRDDTGNTALHITIVNVKTSQVRGLLQYLLQAGLDVNAVNSGKQTPLIEAAGRDKSAAVRVLLEHGADPSTVDDVGNNALCNAC